MLAWLSPPGTEKPQPLEARREGSRLVNEGGGLSPEHKYPMPGSGHSLSSPLFFFMEKGDILVSFADTLQLLPRCCHMRP